MSVNDTARVRSLKAMVRILLVVVALLLGAIFGIVTGLLTVLGGAGLAAAFIAGGVAFGSVTTLALVVKDHLIKK